MTSFCRRLLQRLAFSKLRYFNRDKDPANTMARRLMTSHSRVVVTAISGHWWQHIHGASALKGQHCWMGGGGAGVLAGGARAVAMKIGE